MKKLILTAGAAVAALSFAGIASAATPCPFTYQHPAKAAKLTSALVQAFVSCGNPGGNTPNTFTEGGTTVPACYPAQTYNEQAGSPNAGWLWGPKSQGTISFKAGKNKITTYDNGTKTNPEGAVDLYIQVKISDIRNGGGPADGSTGSVATVARATLIDREIGEAVTVIDFPTGFPIVVQPGGKVQKKTSATEILNGLSAPQPALPRCTQIEVVSVLVKDQPGNAFANLGTFLP
jgi:hypothetical protein